MKNSSKIYAVSLGLCGKDGSSIDCFSKAMSSSVAYSENNHLAIDDEVLEQVLEAYMDPAKSRRIDRVSKMGVVASQQCIANFGADLVNSSEDVGVVICTTFGAVESSREFMSTAIDKGVMAASPLIFPFTVPNAATGTLTIEAKLKGFNTTISGVNPVGYAFDLLKLDRAKAILAGGIEELVFDPFQEDDEKKPLLKANYAIGEGAAVFLLATEKFVESNDVKPIFEVCSVGSAFQLDSCDESIDNFDHVDAKVIEKSMRESLDCIHYDGSELEGIVSLAFKGSQKADAELRAIKSIFGDEHPKVIYPKNSIGETFGASDSFGLVAAFCHASGKDNSFVLSNSHQIGGNISSALIRII